MSKNRVSLHRGKNGYAKHNLHEFMGEDKNVNGRYVYADEGLSLEESELHFYVENYTAALEEQNEKYRAKGNYSRMKSMQEFYESKRYRPTESIIQYGHAGGRVPDKKTYTKMMDEYMKWQTDWSKKHGNHLHVLSYINHFDEATPHTHERTIWDYEDDKGITRIGQEEAMKRAGLPLPDPSKPVGQFNNRAMTWTAMCREKWQNICESNGYEVERVPLPGKQKSKTIPQYKAQKEREIQAREQELDERDTALTKEFLDIVGDITGYEYDLEQITIDEAKNDLRAFRDSLLEREERVDNMLEDAERFFNKGQEYRDTAKKYYHQEQEWLSQEGKKHIQDENRKEAQKKAEADAERERIRRMQEQRKKDKKNEARINEIMAEWGEYVEQAEDDTQYQ